MTDPKETDSKEKASNRRDFLSGISPLNSIQRNSDESLGPTSHAANSDAISQNRQSGYLEFYSKNAMACEFEIIFNLHQYTHSGIATMEAFQLIDLLEDQLTIYRDHSELSQINQTAFQTHVPIETRLFDLLSLAKTIYLDTEGSFDITSGPLTKLWGFEKRKGTLPTQSQIDRILPSIGSNHFFMNHQDSTITFSSPDLMLNLGGIGKGHALDRVKELFIKKGIEDFIVHGGQSSVISSGNSDRLVNSNSHSSESIPPNQSAPELGWTVGISHPTLPSHRFGEVYLRNQALGTSGTARQGFYHQGKRYGHIIDPRTGWPASHYLSTTVISKSAAISDALATAFFVMPLEQIQSYCDRHPEIGTILIADNHHERGQFKIETFNMSKDAWKQLS